MEHNFIQTQREKFVLGQTGRQLRRHNIVRTAKKTEGNADNLAFERQDLNFTDLRKSM